MNRIRARPTVPWRGFGVELVDVRIKRADLPPENSQAMFRRMQTEREREAKELRAQGAEIGQRIRARADRERRVLIAEAEREFADPARPGRRRGDRHLRRGVRPGPGVLRLLPLAAGLPDGAGRRRDQLRPVAGQPVLPLLQRASDERAGGTGGRGLPGAISPPAARRRPRSAGGRAPRPRASRFRGEARRSPMTDLGTGLALVLVVEGVLWALFPDGMKQAAARAICSSAAPCALGGLAFAGLGVLLVWLVAAERIARPCRASVLASLASLDDDRRNWVVLGRDNNNGGSARARPRRVAVERFGRGIRGEM